MSKNLIASVCIVLLLAGCASVKQTNNSKRIWESTTITTESRDDEAVKHILAASVIELRNMYETELVNIRVEKEQTLVHLDELRKQKKWSKLLVWVGAGGGGIISAIANFVPENDDFSMVGGYAGAVGIVAIGVSTAFDFQPSLIQEEYDAYQRYLYALIETDDQFSVYKVELYENSEEKNIIEEAKTVLAEGRARLKAANPLINYEGIISVE
ncbi:hypothetical protein [Sediminispirochaeta bajacaliforniensis]|uniref:hypothetical protein n=1 Tax=Sediminispirochaeta bajacaliforniensis TaxID=148 RepID=UPI0003787721|nr:hypothetical protein [Sediminispirochaeta bajacaliforniensis]